VVGGYTFGFFPSATCAYERRTGVAGFCCGKAGTSVVGVAFRCKASSSCLKMTWSMRSRAVGILVEGERRGGFIDSENSKESGPPQPEGEAAPGLGVCRLWALTAAARLVSSLTLEARRTGVAGLPLGGCSDAAVAWFGFPAMGRA
jgi:hypothetical protein